MGGTTQTVVGYPHGGVPPPRDGLLGETLRWLGTSSGKPVSTLVLDGSHRQRRAQYFQYVAARHVATYVPPQNRPPVYTSSSSRVSE